MAVTAQYSIAQQDSVAQQLTNDGTQRRHGTAETEEEKDQPFAVNNHKMRQQTFVSCSINLLK